MFMAPAVRTEEFATSGGGSMMAGCGPCGAVLLSAAPRSGGGATTLKHYADPVSEVDRRAAAYLAQLTAGPATQNG